jgi:tRNA-dependent cyclodipeptide synthase
MELNRAMKIQTYLNTTKEKVEAKEYNIWFGISLGNKYFSKENLEKCIPWLVDHSKDRLLIVIADDIHAINIEILDGFTQGRSANVAQRKGLEKEKEIKEIISRLPLEKQSKISVVRWKDIEDIDEKKEIYRIVKEEFLRNEKFKDYVISIVKEYPKAAKQELTNEEYDRLAEYILRELPIYLNGTYYNGVRYLLQPYPGLSKLDTLIMGIQDGTLFPELTRKLKIQYEISILEAYAE